MMALALLLGMGCNLERQASIKVANKGVEALNNGEFEVALGYLKKALLKDPTNTNAANLMGQIYFHDLRNHEDAEKAFLVVLESDETHTDTLYRLGWLNFELERFEKATLYFNQCLSNDPEHGHCHYFHGKLAERNNDLEGANDSYRKAAKFAPRDPRAFNSLADLYTRVHARDEAIQVLEEGIRLNPDDAEARQKLGSLLLEGGDPARAAQMFLDAAGLAPNQHELLFAVGAAYVQCNENESASHFLSRYLGKPEDGRKVERPNETLARVMLENLRRGPRKVVPVGER